jgi:hypothetical protein
MHLGGIMSSATKRFIADLAERAGKVFIYAYLASWVSRGVEYDTLFTQDNAEAGVVGAQPGGLSGHRPTRRLERLRQSSPGERGSPAVRPITLVEFLLAAILLTLIVVAVSDSITF